MATNLVNGKTPKIATPNFQTFKMFYDEQNESRKAEIRLSMAILFNITENAIWRRIKLSAFDPFDINRIYETLGIDFRPKKGFFFAPNVSIMETLDNHGLSK